MALPVLSSNFDTYNVVECNGSSFGAQLDSIPKYLGQGSFGKVYQYRRKSDGRDVAVKVVNKAELTTDVKCLGFDDDETDRIVERNMAEAKSLGQFKEHPFIVQLFDDFHFGVLNYIVMELCEGESLAKAIAYQRSSHQNGSVPFPENLIRELMRQLGEALKSVHEKQMVHRDVRAENVLLTSRLGTPGCVVKLGDFGIARPIGRSATTKVGATEYTAPERFAGEVYDFYSEMFALGVLVYFVAALRLPFTGYRDAVMNAIIHRDPEPIPDRFAYSSELHDIVNKLLTKKPKIARGTIAEYLNDPWFATSPKASPETVKSFDSTSKTSDELSPRKLRDPRIQSAVHSSNCPRGGRASSTGGLRKNLFDLKIRNGKIAEEPEIDKSCLHRKPQNGYHRNGIKDCSAFVLLDKPTNAELSLIWNVSEEEAGSYCANLNELDIKRDNKSVEHLRKHLIDLLINRYDTKSEQNLLHILVERGLDRIFQMAIDCVDEEKFERLCQQSDNSDKRQTPLDCLYWASPVERRSQWTWKRLCELATKLPSRLLTLAYHSHEASTFGLINEFSESMACLSLSDGQDCQLWEVAMLHGFVVVDDVTPNEAVLIKASLDERNDQLLRLGLDEKSLEIFLQARSGEWDKIFDDLESDKFYVNSMLFKGLRLLHVAVQQKSNVEAERLLNNFQADVNAQDDGGETALHCAAKACAVSTLALLLKVDRIDVNSKDKYGATPLHRAAVAGSYEATKMLLEHNANPSLTNHLGETALHWAAGTESEAVVGLLLEANKAEASRRDNAGYTPLHWAARARSESTTSSLLRMGEANVSAKDEDKGDTPLHWAAQQGSVAVTKLLLAEGKANANAANKWGETPLHWAAAQGHDLVVELLLEAGANPRLGDKTGDTPLHQAAAHGRISVVKLLLEVINPNVANNNLETALHYAARWPQGEAVAAYLVAQESVDVNAKDKKECATALHWAARWGNESLVQQLIEKGAKVDANDRNGDTAVHWAARRGSVPVAKRLIDEGADPVAKNYLGQTAEELSNGDLREFLSKYRILNDWKKFNETVGKISVTPTHHPRRHSAK